jgi:hypothetical protein
VTVSISTNKISYAGDAGTSIFPFTFKIFETSDLKVTLRDSTGGETVETETTHYVVTPTTEALLDSGGNVTMVTPPAVGESLVIERDLDYVQETDLPAGGAFAESTIEKVFDRLTMYCQQLFAKVNVCLKVPTSDSTTLNLELPSSTDRASKYLAFDASGDPIVSGGGAGSATAPVSVYGSTLIMAANSISANLLLKMSVIPKTDAFTIDTTYAFQTVAITVATAKTGTVPAASAAYSGVWIDLVSLGEGVVTLTLASGNWWNSASIGGSFALGRKCRIWCDGTYWYASPLKVKLAYSAFNLVSGGTSATWASTKTAMNAIGVPLFAKKVSGILYTSGAWTLFVSSNATAGGSPPDDTELIWAPVGAAYCPFSIDLTIPQTIFYCEVGGAIGITITSWEC